MIHLVRNIVYIFIVHALNPLAVLVEIFIVTHACLTSRCHKKYMNKKTDMLVKVLRSSTIWLLIINIVCSVVIAQRFAGWDEQFYQTRFKTFVLCMFWLVFAPRLVGMCLGSWG